MSTITTKIMVEDQWNRSIMTSRRQECLLLQSLTTFHPPCGKSQPVYGAKRYDYFHCMFDVRRLHGTSAVQCPERRLWATDKIVSAYLCSELQVLVSQNIGNKTNFMEWKARGLGWRMVWGMVVVRTSADRK